jgi:NitT/TauT family transport system substrate-binding protein
MGGRRTEDATLLWNHRLRGLLSMSKRLFASAACVLLCFTVLLDSCRQASSRATAGLTPVTLQADWYPQPEHGGFYTALARGYYRDEGIDLTILPGGPYAVAGKQVAAGAAQFGMGTSDSILEAIADGQPLIAVSATMQRDPQGIMVRKDSPVHSFVDLNGQTVAVKPGSTWFEYLVKRYRLDRVREIPATYSVANFVADPHYIQQAFPTSEPFFAHRAGVETRMLLTSEAGYSPYRVLFTNQDFLRQHPEIVAKIVHASLRGWRDYLEDPSAAHAVIAQLNPALSPDWMQFSWQALRDGHFVMGDDPSGKELGQMTPQRWHTMYQQLYDLQMFARPFNPDIAYTLEFVRPN